MNFGSSYRSRKDVTALLRSPDRMDIGWEWPNLWWFNGEKLVLQRDWLQNGFIQAAKGTPYKIPTIKVHFHAAEI